VGYTPLGSTTAEKRRSHPSFAALVGRFQVATEMLGKLRKPKSKRTRSRVESPVALCRSLYEDLGGYYSRAELIAICVDLGVNRNTASTQYWRWNNELVQD